MKEQNSCSLSTIEMAIAGPLTAGVDLALLQPIQLLKTKAQNGGRVEFHKTFSGYFAKQNYRGVVAHFAGYGGASAVMFPVYSIFDTFFPYTSDAVKGFASGVAASVPVTIADAGQIAKQTLPKHLRKTTTYSKIYSDLLRINGIRGIVKGGLATSLREGGWGLGVFAIKDSHKLMPNFMNDNYPIFSSYFAKATGFIVVSGATNIPDVVKTRVQSSHTPYKNSVDATLGIIKNEGWSAFLFGMKYRVAKGGLGLAVVTTTFEAIKAGVSTVKKFS